METPPKVTQLLVVDDGGRAGRRAAPARSLPRARRLMTRRRRLDRRARARVRLLTCDVDGVLTDGRIYVDDDGREIEGVLARSTASACSMLARRRHRRRVDHRQRRARGRASRAQLGIAHVIQDAQRQARRRGDALARELRPRARRSARTSATTCPTCRCCARCGFAVTVPHAPAAVRAHAHYVTRARRRPAARCASWPS